jgi:hypothetical protein
LADLLNEGGGPRWKVRDPYSCRFRKAPEGEEQITSFVEQPATPVQRQMPVLQCPIIPTAHPWWVPPAATQNLICAAQSR